MHHTTLADIHKLTPGLAQLLSFHEVCSLLRKSRSGLYKLIKRDTSFPACIKDQESRSARAYFDASEIALWQAMQRASRIKK